MENMICEETIKILKYVKSRLSFKGGCWSNFAASLDTQMHKHALLKTCFYMRTVTRRKNNCGHAAPETHTFKKDVGPENDRDVAKNI